MKYIRTKYGIHFKNIFNKETSEKEWESLGYDVVKESDTIEELCDMFVLFDEDNVPTWVGKMNYEYCKHQCKYNAFYGAIWTDKGLIYVAKLNKKGQWELI